MYRNLPPGLQRRMAYSNELNSRRNPRRIYSDSELANIFLNIFSGGRRIFQQQHRNPIITSPIINRNPIEIIITPFRRPPTVLSEYETFSNFQDVKIGLISKKLFENSSINICENNEEKDICIICQDDIKNKDILRKIKCKHFFHINCIDKWLTENKKCPICKCEI